MGNGIWDLGTVRKDKRLERIRDKGLRINSCATPRSTDCDRATNLSYAGSLGVRSNSLIRLCAGCIASGVCLRFCAIRHFWIDLAANWNRVSNFPGFSSDERGTIFRVLLLPNPVEKAGTIAQWGAATISLFLFVIYHPANAYTFFPAGRKVFVHPVFLFLAALLGLICTLAYLHSGSLWTPVFLHWIVVAVWLLLLGGYQKLHT